MKAGQSAIFNLSAAAGFGPREESKVESLALSAMGELGAKMKAGNKIMGFKDGKPVEGRLAFATEHGKLKMTRTLLEDVGA